MMILYNLLLLKRLFKKNEVIYSNTSINQLPGASSQIVNNIDVLDLA
jgi:hypothetical protein